MGLTTFGLANGGFTAHYGICYDTSFTDQQAAIDLTNDLIDGCEQDFALVQEWFGGIGIPFDYPLGVQVLNQSGGGYWPTPPPAKMTFGSGSFIQLKPGSDLTASTLRYILVSEVSEMFMMQLDNGWFVDKGWFQGGDEGSMGEGLSRFMGAQCQITNGFGKVPPAGFAIVQKWLNADRGNFVDNAPDDNGDNEINGCTTAFIWFLRAQLGASINRIVQAGSSRLAGVYSNLIGDVASNAWNSFSGLVNLHYPSIINNQHVNYEPAGDNIFPVSDLSSLTVPAEITCGYSKTGEVVINQPAMAEVHIQVSSSTPQLASVLPSDLVIAVGATKGQFTIKAADQTLPFSPQAAVITARYAGATKSSPVTVVCPTVASLTPALRTVICGDSTKGTVTLDHPSTDGSAPVIFTSGDTSLVTVRSPEKVAQSMKSATFVIDTVEIAPGFAPQSISVFGALGGVQKSMIIKVVSPTVASLTFTPATLPLGGSGTGVVTLDHVSYLGDIVVAMSASGENNQYTPSQVTVHKGSLSSQPFPVKAPASLGAFEASQALIYAAYDVNNASAWLTFTPSGATGVLASLTVEPVSVRGGASATGIVALESAVSGDTAVGIAVFPTVRLKPGSQIPLPRVGVPASVIIPAGQTSATFPVGTEPLLETATVHTVIIAASAYVMKQVTFTVT